MSPERLQEGLEWAWRQSYSWSSIGRRLTGAPWSILPLWVSLNFGYRYYAHHLPEKTWPVFRDPEYMERVGRRDDAEELLTIGVPEQTNEFSCKR